MALAAVVLALLAVAASNSLHGAAERAIAFVSEFIARSPTGGAAAFTALAALSAMLAFFSSALLVPVGVYHWGAGLTFALLWAGWLLGGATTYAIGRGVGTGLVRWLTSAARVEYYQERIGRHASFGAVLIFQLAVPSEIPGYVLGTARYSFPRYFAALALAELPYALGAVFLGSSFLRREYGLIALLGGAGIVLGALAVRRLRQHLAGTRRVNHASRESGQHVATT